VQKLELASGRLFTLTAVGFVVSLPLESRLALPKCLCLAAVDCLVWKPWPSYVQVGKLRNELVTLGERTPTGS
jgi:hypothetical protein